MTEGESVQAAIERASPGDVVGLQGGTFTEQIVVDRELTLTGVGPERTVLRAPPSLEGRFRRGEQWISPVISLESSGAKLQNMQVEGARAERTDHTIVGIGCTDPSVDIGDVRVTGSETASTRPGIGILVYNDDCARRGAVVEDCEICDYRHSGIVAQGTGLDVRVTESTVTGIGPTDTNRQHGIRVSGTSRATLLGNTVADNYYRDSSIGAGILVDATRDVFVAWNDIEGNNSGIAAQKTGDIVARRNNIRPNDTGALNLGAKSFDATNNWWGSPDGPSISKIWTGNGEGGDTDAAANGSGDAIVNVSWQPYATSPVDTSVWSRVGGRS
ncbi:MULTISPECIES: right-handed parallel beta-helix repeat-containing protein [Salinibaculum]|uniref:right-handed parallel beta-helix repeat-containing protein n=1 Tax=Salinibaculum TaxID=2732368 RepID=UPI0030CBF55D